MDSNLVTFVTVFCCVLVHSSKAGFTEVPQTLNVTAGTEAVFRCQHSSADSVGWRVNGTSIERNPLPGVSEGSGSLTILALPELSGIIVECVALFFDGSPPDLTPPAYLIVQGGCSNSIAIAFIEEPQSQNVVIGETAEFNCSHPTADYIGWSNGTSPIDNNNSSNISTISISLPGGQPPRHVLIVGAIPTYNGTIVICVARFTTTNCRSQLSDPAVLLIQGPLLAVSGVIRGFISYETFSWNPPPTLDLTNVEPDIAYCVIIHNITCGRNDFLIGDCSLTDNFYIYEDIHPSVVYQIEVIPRSNVARAMNGTPHIVQEKFVNFQLSRIWIVKEEDNVTVTVEVTPDRNVSGYRIYPEQYVVAVKEIIHETDGVDSEPYQLKRSFQGDTRSITFTLRSRQQWQYNFLAYDCEEHSIASMNISTYDVQNILVTSPLPGELRLTGSFINGSTATGILIIVYPLSNDADHNVHYISGQVDDQMIEASVNGLNHSQYTLSVFAIEKDGRPVSRVEGVPIKSNVTGGERKSQQKTSIEYQLKPNPDGHGACITCTFLYSSTTDCVAVVHQRISQLSSSGLMNIESSYRFNRSDNKAYGCIKGVNLKKYLIGVIGGSDIAQHPEAVRPGESTNVAIPVAISGVFFALIGGMVVITIIWTHRYCKRTRSVHYGMPVAESQESESRYQALPLRSLRGFEDSTTTTHADINSELPTYDQVAALADFPDAYQRETRESPFVYQASTNIQTDSQKTTPFTIENLVKYLLPVADKWKDLGEILSMTDNILDEIFTMCDSPQDCLQEMLKYYLIRSDLVRDWVEITNALRKVGEEALANKISQGRFMSDTNVLDREPTEAVPTMEESVGDCESCGDLAIATPQVTPNQATEDYPTSDSGVTLLVGLSVSIFHAQKTEAEQVHVASSSDHDDLELAYPIPETVQEADPARSQCIHLQHDDQREIDQESIGESDKSHDSSSCIHGSGLNEDYSNVRRHRHFSVNPTELQRPSHEYVISSHHHVYSDSEEWHSSSLCHVHPGGTQALQIEPCIHAESDDQLNTCTTEPHNVIRFMEDLQAEHCAPEPSSIV